MAKVFASVLLRDGKIWNWKISGNPKYNVYDWSMRLSDRLDEWNMQSVVIEFYDDSTEQRNSIFSTSAPNWFKRWELHEEYYLPNKPY